MSASLVGSEMCIRDRRIPVDPTGWQARFASARCPRGPQGRPLRGSCEPVSYTHLTLPTICSV
eukprot:4577793-Alexandrium_andersonii.AAC.1